MNSSYTIEIYDPIQEPGVAKLIRETFSPFETENHLLAATFRRVSDLTGSYSQEGCQLFVAVTPDRSEPIGCVGLGTLHNLPLSEGVGEIRDLVVDSNFRQRGIGKKLLDRCLDKARVFGYKRLYLETSKNMKAAQHLFIRKGFKPVTEMPSAQLAQGEEMPCYFMMETNLD